MYSDVLNIEIPRVPTQITEYTSTRVLSTEYMYINDVARSCMLSFILCHMAINDIDQ